MTTKGCLFSRSAIFAASTALCALLFPSMVHLLSHSAFTQACDWRLAPAALRPGGRSRYFTGGKLFSAIRFAAFANRAIYSPYSAICSGVYPSALPTALYVFFHSAMV